MEDYLNKWKALGQWTYMDTQAYREGNDGNPESILDDCAGRDWAV